MKDPLKNRFLRLVLGTVTLFFGGIIYAWSILKAPLGAEFGWTSAQLAVNFTVMMCFFCLGGLVSGLIARKVSIRLRTAVSGVLVFVGFFLASRLTGESTAMLYLSYGFMAGLGIGVVYNVVIAATNAWFPDKKGLCTGTMMMGFGFSTLILGKLAGTMIAAPAIGWRMTYVILGAAIGGVILFASFFLQMPPAGTVFPKPAGAAKKGGETVDYTASQMLGRLSFYKIFFFLVLLASVGNAAISFAKDYFMVVGVTDSVAVTVVGVLSICNGLGRLCSGAVFDLRGLRATQYVAAAAGLLGPGLALAALYLSSTALGILGLCICGFSYGFVPTMSASMSAAFYGPKNFSLNFSIMNLLLIPASFVATLGGSLVTATGSYIPIFLILVGFNLVGLVINLSIRKA